MNLTRGTRTMLVALTVAGSALVAPAVALADTPADEPTGPDDIANPTENPPDPDPCELDPDLPQCNIVLEPPNPCLADPDLPECDDPGGNPGGDPGDDDPQVVPEADVDEPVLANPTFTG